jgi:hypothetical protein
MFCFVCHLRNLQSVFHIVKIAANIQNFQQQKILEKEIKLEAENLSMIS